MLFKVKQIVSGGDSSWIFYLFYLATQCVTAAPAPVVAAMAIAETGGAAYSIQIGNERSISPDFDAAVQAAAIGLLDGANVKVGITAIATQEFDKRGIAYSEGFSACRNMEIAGDVLREAWEQFGGQDEHWRLAVLEVVTGAPSVEGEFSQSFDLALVEIQKIIQNNPDYLSKFSVQLNNKLHEAISPIVNDQQQSEPTNTARSWDIYNRSSSTPLLVFSK